MAFPKKRSDEVFENRDLEIEDPEESYSERINFSHEGDVARAIRRVQETGSKEMRPGWFDIKRDKTTGEIIEHKYNTDSREEYIESVNNYIDILIAEIEKNKEIKSKIKELEESKDICYKKWANYEHLWWTRLPRQEKLRFRHMENVLNNELPFYAHYMKEVIKISREITRTLHRLLFKLQYFRLEDGEN